MSESQSSSGPSPDKPQIPADGAAGKAPAPRKHDRRVRILQIVAAVLAAGFMLLLIAPTILSTSPFVSIALGQVNKQLNGKVQLSSLSLGWFSGVKADGMRVFDASGAQIAEVDHATISYPLLKAITGSMSFGDVLLDGVSFDARIDSEGNLNFAKLVKQSPSSSNPGQASPAEASKPSKLPNYSAHVKLTNCHGTISKPDQPAVYMTKLEGDVNIPNINDPITDTFNAALKVGDGPEATVAIDGTAAAIKSNVVAVDSANLHQTVDVQNFDLQMAKPFIPDSVGVSTLAGTMGIHVAVDVTNGKAATLDTTVTATKPISLGGTILKGDTFATNAFVATIPKLTGDFPDGLSQWQTGRIKVGSVAGSAPILLKLDQGQLTATMDVTPQEILNLKDFKNPGSSGQVVVASSFDLAGIISKLRNTVSLAPGVAIQSGGCGENVVLRMTPEKAELFTVADITRVTGTTKLADGQIKPIAVDPIHCTFSTVDLGGGGMLPDLQLIALNIQAPFVTGAFQGQTLSDLHGNLTANLASMCDQVRQFVDLGKSNVAGTVTVSLADKGQLKVAPFQATVQANVGLNNFTFTDSSGQQHGKQPVMQMVINADLQGSAATAVQAVKQASIAITAGANSGNLVTASISDAKLSMSGVSMMDKLQSAHWQANVPDLKGVSEMVNTFSPATSATPVVPAAAAKASAEKPLPPLQFNSGVIAASGDVSHDGSTMKFSVNQLSGQNIAFTRGDIQYVANPMNAKLQIAVQTGDGKTLMEQIHQVQVTELTGNLGIATLSMPTPISISQLSSNPVATGAIQLVGNLTDLTTLMAAMDGEKPDAYPYRGDYTLSENIATQQSTISLKGGMQIAKFQSYDGSNVTFSEDQVAIANDLALTMAVDDESVAINSLTAAMQSSGAMNVSMKNGSIQNLQTTRKMQLQLNVAYDLQKLWPIVQPIMGDSYKTLKITGAFQKQFNVTGSYPANQPSTVAIKTLHADGDLAVASLDYNGISMQNFVVPFTLDNGQFVTIYAGKPAGQNTAPVASCNGGSVDLSNLTVDLTQEPPRLSTPPSKALLSQITVNPVFAGSVLEKLINNPLFADGKTGLIDVSLDDCTNLPLGDLVMQQSPANTGKADLRVSVTKINIGLPPNDQLATILKQSSFEANVKDGTVSIANGMSIEHINFNTGPYVLSFDGGVRLSDQAYVNMVLGFPLKIIAAKTHLVRGKAADYMPDQIKVPLEGTVSKTSYRFDKILPQAIADAAAKALAGGLLGGNKGNGDDNGGGGGDNSNPLGDLLKKLQKKQGN